MTTSLLHETLPEWQPFAEAVHARSPDAGTWCEAWTVRDIVAHQAGNAEELSRVLGGGLEGEFVPTRSFEDREAPYRALNDRDLWAALVASIEHLCEIADAAARDLAADASVAWTGRTMNASWFAEHMREELVLHRWDITGDDSVARRALAEPWMTEHSVVAVGSPLLIRGAADLDLAETGRVEGRLRVEGAPDVVVVAKADKTQIFLEEPQGEATIVSDAATRCLLLWGRRPSDPSRWRSSAGPDSLRRVRTLLSGY